MVSVIAPGGDGVRRGEARGVPPGASLLSAKPARREPHVTPRPCPGSRFLLVNYALAARGPQSSQRAVDFPLQGRRLSGRRSPRLQDTSRSFAAFSPASPSLLCRLAVPPAPTSSSAFSLMHPNSSVVVVTFASESVLPLLDNWIAHLHRARIQDALVACFDARACVYAEHRGVATEYVPCPRCAPTSACPSSGQGSPLCRRGFREMMLARLRFALKFVLAGQALLVSDADNVFTRPPVPALHALLGGSGVDVAAPLDLWADWWNWPTSVAQPAGQRSKDGVGNLFMQQLNSGAIYYAATRGAAAVLARAVSLVESGACDHVAIIDQWALNAAIGGVQAGAWSSHEPTLLCPTAMVRETNVTSSATNVTARIVLLPGAIFSDTRGNLAHWRYLHEPVGHSYAQQCGGLKAPWWRCAHSRHNGSELDTISARMEGDACRYDVIVEHERCRTREQAEPKSPSDHRMGHRRRRRRQREQKRLASLPIHALRSLTLGPDAACGVVSVSPPTLLAFVPRSIASPHEHQRGAPLRSAHTSRRPPFIIGTGDAARDGIVSRHYFQETLTGKIHRMIVGGAWLVDAPPPAAASAAHEPETTASYRHTATSVTADASHAGTRTALLF